jgi:hypothetical protein
LLLETWSGLFMKLCLPFGIPIDYFLYKMD